MGSDSETTVLVVDDEPQLVSVFEVYLQERFRVRTATGGEAALELIDGSVDVVLLDRRMPGMSGDEVLSELRRQGHEVPVGMATAADPDADIVEMPFDEYLIKPIDRDELLSAVDRLVTSAEFDERSREFFRLAVKKEALEGTEGPLGEEYDRILERMEALRAELDGTLEELATDRSGDR